MIFVASPYDVVVACLLWLDVVFALSDESVVSFFDDDFCGLALLLWFYVVSHFSDNLYDCWYRFVESILFW